MTPDEDTTADISADGDLGATLRRANESIDNVRRQTGADDVRFSTFETGSVYALFYAAGDTAEDFGFGDIEHIDTPGEITTFRESDGTVVAQNTIGDRFVMSPKAAMFFAHDLIESARAGVDQ